LKQEQI